MNVKRIFAGLTIWGLSIFGFAQGSGNEANQLGQVVSAEALQRAPVPTNVVSLLAVRTQAVNGVPLKQRGMKHQSASSIQTTEQLRTD
jgi:hypothetical protein